MLEKVESFKTSDGKLFATEAEAIRHEKWEIEKKKEQKLKEELKNLMWENSGLLHFDGTFEDHMDEMIIFLFDNKDVISEILTRQR